MVQAGLVYGSDWSGIWFRLVWYMVETGLVYGSDWFGIWLLPMLGIVQSTGSFQTSPAVSMHREPEPFNSQCHENKLLHHVCKQNFLTKYFFIYENFCTSFILVVLAVFAIEIHFAFF
jgi:hypothetical protein